MSQKSYRIAYQHPWLQNAEHQCYECMRIAARRLGHELVHVKNSAEIESQNFDFVLCVASLQGKTTRLPTFGAIHEPRVRWWEDRSNFWNLASYDGYFTVSDSLNSFVKAFCAGIGRSGEVGYFFNTPPTMSITADLPAIIARGRLQLCYFGTNWDPRSRPLFRELAKRPYMRIHGPEKAWAYLEGQSYYGMTPFDGDSVQQTYAEGGAGLVSLSKNHTLDDVISNRIFEITSVGAAAIVPDIPWIRKNYGDSVYYYDPFSSPRQTASQIDMAIKEIEADPASASKKALRARDIFQDRFSAEALFQNVVTYYEAWAAKRDREDKPLTDLGVVDIIVRTGGRPIETVLRAIESIDAQYAGRFNVILVLWKTIDLTGIIDREWQRIDQFTIVECIGGNRAKTMTAGLKAVTGAYFGFLDDDDYFLPNHVSSLLAELSKLPAEAAFAHSGLVQAIEGDAAADMKDHIAIRQIEPLSGGFSDVMGRFSVHNWLASSALLKQIDLENWSMHTAEDTTLIGNLIARASVAFSWRATAVFVSGSADSSNYDRAVTRQDDLFETYLRIGPRIYDIERKFARSGPDLWERLGIQIQKAFARKIEATLPVGGTLVVQEGAPAVPLQDRDDIEVREVPISADYIYLNGDSRIVPTADGNSLEILPKAEAWAYGCEIEIPRDLLFEGPQQVVIEFARLKGSWGVGLLNRDASDYLTRSDTPTSDRPTELWTFMANPDWFKSVVIQNWAFSNSESAIVSKIWLAREKQE